MTELQKVVSRMIQYNKDEGIYKSLDFYDGYARLVDLSEKVVHVISFNPLDVDWELISLAECMLMDEIILGDDLSDYFGPNYNVCIKDMSELCN